MIPKLSRLTRALHGFVSTAGITIDGDHCDETPDHYRFTVNQISAAGLRSITAQQFDELINLFGDAISVRCQMADLPVLRIGRLSDAGGTLPSIDFDAFLDQTDDDMFVSLRVQVSKRRLLQHWQLPDFPTRHFQLYFQTNNLVRLLESALSQPALAQDFLWAGQPGQAVVLVAEGSHMVLGKFLNILGADELGIIEKLPSLSQSEIDQQNDVHKTCRGAIRWEDRWTDFLTPDYFDISPCNDASSHPVQQRILMLGTNVSLLFMADRVRQHGTGFLAHFESLHHRAFVPSASMSDLTPPANSPQDFNVDDSLSIIRLAAAVYQQQWRSDRLALLQVVVSRVLDRGQDEVRHHSFIDAAPQINDDFHRHWKSFINESIEKYVKEEVELENEIASTVDGYERQVASMIGGLSATTLAAVGVIIGTFIAAAFAKEFNAVVFRVGIGVYMGYLLVFPGAYNLTNHCLRYRVANEIFRKREQRFHRLLGEEGTRRIVGNDIAKAQTRFNRWLWATIGALLFVFVACAMVMWLVPPLVAPTTSP